ncbi:MAG: alpha-glucan family phosphorylase [Bacteroidales bacterium]|nr:alpha-glucan family phosphorylase [Bacteroidales bacterium]MDY0285178.1 alpha-glucan family phosphorylase [Bacteroidales bacterium]HPE87336.1 alpha-glucan family phosphorylase [Bacteroidales bacterium]
MSEQELNSADFVFEISWESCNKVGGIYTVLSTKAAAAEKQNGVHIFMGPDVWKETADNPYFIEDNSLFPVWKEKANAEGLLFRTGRWNIPGKPLAILVDFTAYFPEKDRIFAGNWEKYKLDSLSGGWDYVEPALFGYAAARVIESYYEYNLGPQDRIVAHFHEWMTGTGILYLKSQVPQIGTVFTTHATVLGRAIAGNGLKLYQNPSQFNPGEISGRFNLRSKYSLEKLAAQNADCFTTVSSITAEECRIFLGREVDFITPNGFDNGFVASDEDLKEKRTIARKKLLDVASALLNSALPDDAFLMINSGRYEYRNKGIDLFIDSLNALNTNGLNGRTVVAFITIPGDQSGARKDLKAKIGQPVDEHAAISGEYLTHGLHNPGYDQILNHLKAHRFNEIPENNVHVIFVPTYLNGDDGIFDLNYYDLLTGFDLSVFPSYYEPWGYTPLESIAFGIPTITTNLAGFGKWIQDHEINTEQGVTVIIRDDNNYHDAVKQLKNAMAASILMEPDIRVGRSASSRVLSRKLLWENLIQYYNDSYALALSKAALRADLYAYKMKPDVKPLVDALKTNAPVWRKTMVKPVFPEKLKALRALSRNLWWSWSVEAGELFQIIDPALWETFAHNPIAMLENLSYKRLQELIRDKLFMDKYSRVLHDFNTYMAEKSSDPVDIAYFSMEFGIHDSLKIFSGGLGMLAGDYMKEASDSNSPMIGIGLLYRYGYFTQQLSIQGDQISARHPQRFTHLPIEPVRNKEGEWVKITLALPGRNLVAKVWRVPVGRVSLYLLDTDIPENNDFDRQVTHQLYGGDWENRFKQELLLGVGGIRMLEALQLKPKVYHLNEGHAAFAVLERLRYYVQIKHYSFVEAKEIVRSSTLFTTHTPVPAGHDFFHEDLMRTYIAHYPDRLNISWDEFMGLGRFSPGNTAEKFSMSVLAAKMAQEVNGVSKIHGRVSREMFKELYPGFFPEELFICHVTNGVHYPTWVGKEWRRIHEETFGPDFIHHQSDPEIWSKIFSVKDDVIWSTRNLMRTHLMKYLSMRLAADMTRRQENPRDILDVIEGLNPDRLTIGFARRFATYKRAHLLFKSIDRLSAIVNNPKKPVQFIFAGKAHPADHAGQGLIKHIVEISRRPEFIGKIFFIENYDMLLGKALTRGVDVWMNTPTRPLEASGTSGEKAVMNGVLNLSVLDGWWAEGYLPDAGWAIKQDRTYDNQDLQDELDAETIYNLIENEITNAFYTRNEQGIPEQWVARIKKTMAGIAPHFTMKRQLDDYYSKLYSRLLSRLEQVKPNAYAELRKLAYWKQRILSRWDNIEVISVNVPQSTARALCLGDNFKAEVELYTPGFKLHELGMEVVFARKVNDEVQMTSTALMTVHQKDDDKLVFNYEQVVNDPGVIDFAFRLFPVHDLLPHRQDFPLVKWI